MEQPLISVILPIYNVADYLRECVESVIAQTYKNLEIILVDDGSTDNSPKICDEYLNIDERIKVIHKTNGGLSDARNFGIDVSTGEYIALVDSDDAIVPWFVERLYFLCHTYHTLLSACSFDKFSELSEKQQIKEEKPVEVVSAHDLIKKIYQGQGNSIGFTAWNKLYHKSVFQEIRYPKGRIYEDTFVTYRLFLEAGDVAVVDEPLYLYRVRAGSIMTRTVTLKKVKDGIDSEVSVLKVLKEKNINDLIPVALNSFYMNTIKHTYHDIKLLKPVERNTATQYMKTEYRGVWGLYGAKGLPVIKKVIFQIFNLYCKL